MYEKHMKLKDSEVFEVIGVTWNKKRKPLRWIQHGSILHLLGK